MVPSGNNEFYSLGEQIICLPRAKIACLNFIFCYSHFLLVAFYWFPSIVSLFVVVGVFSILRQIFRAGFHVTNFPKAASAE